MSVKKLLVIDGCNYCPYGERIIGDKHSRYYKCNKLDICVEMNKTYLPKPLKHLFKFCPLPNVDGNKIADAPVKEEEEVITYETYNGKLDSDNKSI